MQVLQTQRGLFKYTNMMATILVIFLLVVSVEMLTNEHVRTCEGTTKSRGLLTHFLDLLRGVPERMGESAWK